MKLDGMVNYISFLYPHVCIHKIERICMRYSRPNMFGQVIVPIDKIRKIKELINGSHN